MRKARTRLCSTASRAQVTEPTPWLVSALSSNSRATRMGLGVKLNSIVFPGARRLFFKRRCSFRPEREPLGRDPERRGYERWNDFPLGSSVECGRSVD